MFNSRYFGLFITLIVGMFFIIMYLYFRPQINELNHLHQIEKNIRLDLQKINNEKDTSLYMHKNNKIKTELKSKPNKISDILQDIIQIIEENGFTIQTLKPPELKGAEENIFSVKLLLDGSVKQMASLLTHLSRDNWTIGIQDFSLKVKNDNDTNVENDNKASIENNNKTSIENNNGTSLESDSRANIEITILILKQQPSEEAFSSKPLPEPFKIIGYVHDDNHFFALLLLPNGKTQIVQQGSTIGEYNARIINLSENAVIISQGQQQIQLLQKLSPDNLIRGFS